MVMFIFWEKVIIRAKISLEWVTKLMNLFSFYILNDFIQNYKRNASTNYIYDLSLYIWIEINKR